MTHWLWLRKLWPYTWNPLPAPSPQARVLNSKGQVTTWFQSSEMTLTVPKLGNTSSSFVIRQDLVNAVIATLLPSENFVILLDYAVSLTETEEGTLLSHVLSREDKDYLGSWSVASG